MTELEGAVLGVIWSRGPITSYGVLQRFVTSTTRGWSSSTGAIYPAIKRLTLDGFVRSTPEPADKRSTRQLMITAKGRSALRSWLMELQDWMGGAAVDPVRTRVNYIGALPRAQQLALIARAKSNARSALKELEKFVSDPAAHERSGLEIAALGARADVEARLEWLDQVRALISKP